MTDKKIGIVISATDKTQAAFKSAQAGLVTLKEKADGLFATGGIGLAGGLASTLLGAGFSTAVKSAIDDLDKMDEAAERLGTSTEYLSAMGYAAKLSGVEFEDLNKAFVKFSGQLAAAASGNAEAVDLMRRLGVEAKNFTSLDAALAQVADKFEKTSDGVGKTALAADAFGEKLGSKMVPLLNQGSEGLAAMRQEAEKLGGVIDGKLAKQAADFNDNLDRLKVVSKSASIAIAGELLPTLNRLSEELLAGLKNSDGFLDALMKYGLTNPFKDNAARVAELRREYEQLDFLLSNDRSKNPEKDRERLRSLEQQLNYYKEIEQIGKRETVRPPPTGNGIEPKTPAVKAVKESTRAFSDYDAILTERIARAIENTDIVKAAELEATMRKLDELAAAGLDPAIVQSIRGDLTGATKEAADEFERLAKLLEATPTAKLQELQGDMVFLTKAFEKGYIAEQQYLEAVTTRLDAASDKAKEAGDTIEEFAKQAARNMQDALADFLFDPFKDGTDGMLKNFGVMIQKMIAQAVAADLAKKLFGSLVQGGEGSGLLGGALDWLGGLVKNADGAVYPGAPGLSAYSGSIVSRPTVFPFAKGIGLMGEDGAEAILPLKRGADGKLGVAGGGGHTINVYVQPGSPQDVRRAAGQGAREALAVMNGVRRYG